MICSIINEGTAPRYAPGGLQPTSKPVAPSKHRQYTLDRIGRPKFKAGGILEAETACAARDTAVHPAPDGAGSTASDCA